MKKNLILPLSLGLLLVACSRTETPKTTASNTDPAQPALDSHAAPAPKDPDAVASAPLTPAPAPTAPAPAPSESVASSIRVQPPSTTPEPTPPAADPGLSPNALSSTAAASALATNSAEARQMGVASRISEWRLKGDEIKNEFDSSGRVVRSKTPGAGEPTGPMDSIVVSAVKDKLQNDADLAGQKIDVEADDGVVTLKGSAASLDQIGRAVAISLDTGGVHQAVSTIKLESKQ